MIRPYFLLYFFIFTIPLFMGFAAWQSNHYRALERSIRRLEAVQDEWIGENNKLIANFALLSSSARIEQVAVHDLGLTRIRPESVLQVRIEGGTEY